MLAGLLAVPATAEDAPGSITETVVGSRSFDILEKLVIEAGLADDLATEGLGATMFAATDTAFRRLVFDYVRSNDTRWLSAYKTAFRSSETDIADTIIGVAGDALDDVLRYHVVPVVVPASDAVTFRNFPAPTLLEGKTVEVDGIRNRYVRLTDDLGRKSWVVNTDIESSNGIIHPIDRVILPFGL